MQLNSDFTARVVVHGDTAPWVPSPMAGVDRRMFDRIGEEVARATSIVRYAAGSSFSEHTHTGGEEFIVLSGVFQDEHGDYPAGTYVRNPPTSAHTPRSDGGCVIFVKLWQFDLADRTQKRVDMDAALGPATGGVATALLHQDARETVTYHRLEAGAEFSSNPTGGAEVLVLDGSVTQGGEVLVQHSWLRLPEGADLTLTAGHDGAAIWVKTGHLPFAAAPMV